MKDMIKVFISVASFWVGGGFWVGSKVSVKLKNEDGQNKTLSSNLFLLL